jgi:hypothetical protein
MDATVLVSPKIGSAVEVVESYAEIWKSTPLQLEGIFETVMLLKYKEPAPDALTKEELGVTVKAVEPEQGVVIAIP